MQLNLREKTAYVLFFVHCFKSLEDDIIRKECLRLVSLSLWNSLSPGRVERELRTYPQLTRHWKLLKQKELKQAKDSTNTGPKPESSFMPSLLKEYLTVLEGIGASDSPSKDAVSYCERFVEFLVDLLGQLPTRRFFRVMLDDSLVVIRSRLAPLARMPQGKLFSQLLGMLQFYHRFEINDHTGAALTDDEMMHTHYANLYILQRLAFKYFGPRMREFALTNIASIENRAALSENLSQLTYDRIKEMCTRLKVMPSEDKFVSGETEARTLLIELLISMHEKRLSQQQAINEYSLYPNELILFDEAVVPTGTFTGETCLALPKLNLQFLTFHDYLLRNFQLFRLETTYEIREDIEDSVKRLNPQRTFQGDTTFVGWSRMAMQISNFRVVEVGSSHLGENKPSIVRGEIVIDLKIARGYQRREWEALRQHDVIFLLTVRPPKKETGADGKASNVDYGSIKDKYGITYVRGCEVIEVVDSAGNLVNEVGKRDSGKPPVGDTRTLRVALDTAQYQADLVRQKTEGAEDPYTTFNILLRRKPKENNFKAVLETIRDLMNTTTVVPEWMHDVFLGYGDPGAAAYYNMPPDEVSKYDFNDTFVSADHVKSAFPGKIVKFTKENPEPPFKISFPPIKPRTTKEQKGSSKQQTSEAKPEDLEIVTVDPYLPPDPGPYPQYKPKQNKVPFTPVQVEAIRSGMSPGLTLVVGPPGTGKTDVAVQIISNIYHNFPEQRTLLVTHSNHALNDLFEKIMERDVNEIHLLRLGMGEKELQTEKDFSKMGRVNHMLARRLELLAEIERLAQSLQVATDVAYTCETAAYFYLNHVLARWEEYLTKVRARATPETVVQNFPFHTFFSNAPQPIFKGQSYEEQSRIAEGCFRHLKNMFKELEECRAFELLRSSYDRGTYLLSKQAKIIAMTCTHAAMKRRDLVSLGFKYDNIVMEESAQILEIETFIPLLLQTQEDNISRLKRIILIGDHHQLPPVIKNLAFQKYSQLDQSLFTRFIRLGVPAVQLNFQGRARPSIASLYNWRYKDLGNLPNVIDSKEYNLANAGFSQEVQLIDVGDLNGKGESEPNPYYYQNLAEAEYIVAVYQYMRLLGYPASRISILSTYKGQKHLIRDVIQQRCAWNPFFGEPSKITTVDKYQGQQNDYILLSLVRTRAVGHLRDVRRLVVAMSRARLGLYVFCRKAIFENCYELVPTFRQLLQRPTKLHLILGEKYPTSRKVEDRGVPTAVEDVTHMSLMAYNMGVSQVEQHNLMQRTLAKSWTDHMSQFHTSAEKPPEPLKESAEPLPVKETAVEIKDSAEALKEGVETDDVEVDVDVDIVVEDDKSAEASADGVVADAVVESMSESPKRPQKSD
mmetsp:Transcript_4030/g.6213  ORF Transcript_4030/g.6213 Transcript_4030/m.6213 type:complete len:1352 (+) Transcript_4030:1-4056(+)